MARPVPSCCGRSFQLGPNESVPRTIAADEFENRCLALMDEVNETGDEIVITKHGRPVSRLVPAQKSTPKMWGRCRDQVHITGDIVAPACPADEWGAVNSLERVLDPDLARRR